MLPSQYQPTAPDHFIGPARKHAEMLARLITAAQGSGMPLKLLFNGQPGVGKSTLAAYVSSLLQVHKWSATKLNGTQVKIDTVEDLARSLQFTDMFGSYRMVVIEEADKIPSIAQVRLLTLLDDLPPKTAVACTSNCPIDHFENRFQTRFQVFEVQPPTAAEIRQLLAAYPIPAATAARIAEFACGNVRQALLDAQTALMEQEPLPQAA